MENNTLRKRFFVGIIFILIIKKSITLTGEDKNTFIKNKKNAYDSCNNKWKSNYYDDWIGLRYKLLKFLQYRIPGTILKNFDWSPTNYQNDINNKEVIYD